MTTTLESLAQRGRELLENRGGATRTHSAHERWTQDVASWLAENAPDSGLSAKWISTGLSPLVRGGAYYDDPITWARHSDLVRYQLRWLGEQGPAVARRQPIGGARDVWNLLHPRVVALSGGRFNDGHYADAVEAAFKGLNAIIKDHVKLLTGQELDGATLMTTAFSVNRPLIALDDLTTQSGKDIQQGYMQIFAGAMTGIRNPKAHGNLAISPERALQLLMLASLLWVKFDERPGPAA